MGARFDVIVVGGGHAGAEAAWAAARLGASTALITMDPNAIGRMSCNPAIGGLGKGQMVREIDALGGLMGLATDRAGIQFRMLNRSKGPAVWAPRVQCDRELYPQAVQDLLASAPNLEIVTGSVEQILAPESRGTPRRSVAGVGLLDGRRIPAEAVILTTGTFLGGLMHCGQRQSRGGRVGEPAAMGLSASLAELGFQLGRLKTGTPPRVHRDSVRFEACDVQPGDAQPTPVSFLTDAIYQPQVCCWITWTTPAVHALIRDHLHLAPMYTGQIAASGPRYCPSIEDKVVRFSDKDRHQVFLEPEGYEHSRVYCNGISTSLPANVQRQMIRGIAGLEEAEIVQPGYAVEYDYVRADQITRSLETKRVERLFLAGQINGTSGYEEAAALGLVAGINAVRAIDGRPPFVLGRDEAYIGVMIDDLITRPPSEPYRMFTSRAEYRLSLRADNADQRLTPIGREIGLVDDARWRRFTRRMAALARIRDLCDGANVDGTPLTMWIRRPEADVAAFARALNGQPRAPFGTDDLHQVLIEAKYSGYVARQARQVERFRRLESLRIPRGMNYATIPELRLEAREQLARVNPETIGQASRIPGINPADLTVLWIYAAGKRRATPTNPEAVD
ncbi:MAG: tRNA uridine-5-carboxymethylaminomethyl(34) synthesis enzyme MnmG [Phycisphaerae bacterium]